MDYRDLVNLIEKVEHNTATKAELSVLDEFYESFEHRAGYTAFIPDQQIYEDLLFSRIEAGIVQSNKPMKSVLVKLWPRVTAAIAAAVAAVVFGVWFFSGIRDQDAGIKNERTASVVDIAPGKQGATLTLASGKTIRLGTVADGVLAKEAGVSIKKTTNGQLVYEIVSPPAAALSGDEINTLSTAKGETYQVQLPDGSLVYLNAASSLSYAASLMEKGKRVVRLQGEAYFEIAKATRHSTSARDGRKSERVPFIVYAGNQQVEVLGTHFNINSYSDERAIKTTLLEGSIRLNNKTILKPGEQSTLDSSGKISVDMVDVSNAVAWKKGYFHFEGEDLESIMRKVSRWYDVQVKYRDDRLKKLAFVGTVSRYNNVSQVLKTLQLTNTLDFKIEGRTIVISSGTR